MSLLKTQKQKELEKKKLQEETYRKGKETKLRQKAQKATSKKTQIDPFFDEVKVDSLQKLFDAIYASKDRGAVLENLRTGKIVLRMTTTPEKINEIYKALNDGIHELIDGVQKIDLIIFVFRELRKIPNQKKHEYTLFTEACNKVNNVSERQTILRQYNDSKNKMEYYEMFSINFRLQINDIVTCKKSGMKSVYFDIGNDMDENFAEQENKESEDQMKLKVQKEIVDKMMTEEEKQAFEEEEPKIEDDDGGDQIERHEEEPSEDDQREEQSEEQSEDDQSGDKPKLAKSDTKERSAEDDKQNIVYVSKNKYNSEVDNIIKKNEVDILFNIPIKDIRSIMESSKDWENYFKKTNKDAIGKYSITKNKMDVLLSPDFRRDLFIDITRYQIDDEKSLSYYVEKYFSYCDVHVIEIPDKYPYSQKFVHMIDNDVRNIVRDRLEYVHIPVLNNAVYKFAYNYFFKKLINGNRNNPFSVEATCENMENVLSVYMENLDKTVKEVIEIALSSSPNQFPDILSKKYVLDKKARNFDEFQEKLKREYIYINYSYTLKDCIIKYLQQIIVVNVGRELSAEILDINMARFMIAKESILRNNKKLIEKLDEYDRIRKKDQNSELIKLKKRYDDTKDSEEKENIKKKMDQITGELSKVETFYYGAISRDIRRMKDKGGIHRFYSIFSSYKLRKFILLAGDKINKIDLHEDSTPVRNDVLMRYTRPAFLSFAKRQNKTLPEISVLWNKYLVKYNQDEVIFVTEVLSNPSEIDWKVEIDEELRKKLRGQGSSEYRSQLLFQAILKAKIKNENEFRIHVARVKSYLEYRIQEEIAMYISPNIKTYGKPHEKPLTIPRYRYSVEEDVRLEIPQELVEKHALPLYFRVLELKDIRCTSEDVKNAFLHTMMKADAYSVLGDPGERNRYTIRGLLEEIFPESAVTPIITNHILSYFIGTFSEDFNLDELLRDNGFISLDDVSRKIVELKQKAPELPYYEILNINSYDENEIRQKVVPSEFMLENMRKNKEDVNNIEIAFNALRNDVIRNSYLAKYYSQVSQTRKKLMEANMNIADKEAGGKKLRLLYDGLLNSKVEEQEQKRKELLEKERIRIEEEDMLFNKYKIELSKEKILSIMEQFINSEKITNARDLTLSKLSKYLKDQGKDDIYIETFKLKRQELGYDDYKQSITINDLVREYHDEHAEQYLSIFYDRTKDLSLNAIFKELSSAGDISVGMEKHFEYRHRKDKKKYYKDLILASADVMDISKFVDMEKYNKYKKKYMKQLSPDQEKLMYLSTSDLVELDNVVLNNNKGDKDKLFNILLDIKSEMQWDAQDVFEDVPKRKYDRDLLKEISLRPERFRKDVHKIIEARLLSDNDKETEYYSGDINIDAINDPEVTRYISINFAEYVEPANEDDTDHCTECLKKATLRHRGDHKTVTICSARCVEKFNELKQKVTLPGRGKTESLCRKYIDKNTILNKFKQEVMRILTRPEPEAYRHSENPPDRNVDENFLKKIMIAIEARI